MFRSRFSLSGRGGREEQNLDKRLQQLLKTALEAGASDARVIGPEDMILDPTVRFKCMIPPCLASGTCAHCPPHGNSLEDIKKTVARYEKAVFFRVLVDSRIIAGAGVSEGINQGRFDDQGHLLNLGAHYLLVFQIIALMEKRIRQWQYTPTGFAAGTCRDVLCHFHPVCKALGSKKNCRHPDLSRPSMESCGFDVYTMGANMGWDIFPIGGNCRPDDIPRGSLMGLVLVC